MERLVTVEFGPSRSKRFGKALVEARNGGECTEVEQGRYRVSFALGADSDAYTGLARLLERVRHWRATEVREGDEPLSAYQGQGDGVVRLLPAEVVRDVPIPLLLRRPAPLLALSPVRCRAGDPGRRESACGDGAGDQTPPTPPHSAWAGALSRPRPRLAGSRLPATRMGRASR